MKNKNQVIKRQFDFFLKDFEEDPDPKEIWIAISATARRQQEYQIDLPFSLVTFHPYIVFIIFVYLKKFNYSGIDEKVAWTIPIKYKGIPFLLSHRKFGFGIYINTKDSDIDSAGKEAYSNILKCIPFAEVLFEPTIRNQIEKKKITLANQFKAIKNRYQFFRTKAKREFKKAEESRKIEAKVITKIKGNMTSIQSKHPYSRYILAGNNYTASMMDSFYSLLEHLCVLLIPFLSHIPFKDFNLETFIGHPWKAKLKVILPVKDDVEVQKIITRLEEIKEQLRNPLNHGHFLKNGHSFYVQIPQLGAIPMTMTKNRQHFSYSFSPSPFLKFETICKVFDDFFTVLKSKKEPKFGLQYIESGLAVSFDNKSSDEYKSAMTTVAGFREFIKHEFYLLDQATNMDW